MTDTWTEAFLAAGHTFVLGEDGRPDFFVMSIDIHNGPRCATCGWTCCEHCTPAKEIPPCSEKSHDRQAQPRLPLG